MYGAWSSPPDRLTTICVEDLSVLEQPGFQLRLVPDRQDRVLNVVDGLELVDDLPADGRGGRIGGDIGAQLGVEFDDDLQSTPVEALVEHFVGDRRFGGRVAESPASRSLAAPTPYIPAPMNSTKAISSTRFGAAMIARVRRSGMVYPLVGHGAAPSCVVDCVLSALS